MQWLKQSTDVTVKVGPFVDDSDGKTAETGLTIAQADVRLSKNGGDFAQKGEASSASHDENGYYDVDLNTTDTGTLGRLVLAVSESGALPVRQEYMVVPANMYDSLVGGSDTLQADVTQVSGSAVSTTSAQLGVNVVQVSEDATAADNLEADYDGTGYDKSNSTVGTCTSNTDMRGTDSALLAASAPSNWGDLSITASTGRVDVASIEGSDATDQINAACDTALTDYDAVVPADLPTNFADLAITAADGYVTVGTSHDKAGYSISGTLTTLDDLENISSADVNAACDTALTDYDAPTKNELDALQTHGDSNWATATGFSTHAAADVVSALWASSGWDDTGTLAFGDAVEHIWAVNAGNISKSGDAYTYDKPDDSTDAITLTLGTDSRTRS